MNDRDRDQHRLNPRESRTCVAKLMEGLQNAKFHGDITLKFRGGELVHVESLQSALPRDILQEKFLCVLLTSTPYDQENVQHQHTGSSQPR